MNSTYRIADLLGVIVTVGLIAFLLSFVGPSLDRHDDELQRDLAAARDCREKHGPSLIVHDHIGQPVCIPRGEPLRARIAMAK